MFSWSANHKTLTATESRRSFLLRIQDELRFKHGRINLVVGPTGSGKTSLLMALMGEMCYVPTTQQSILSLPREGGVAYAAQEPWIQNDTIRVIVNFATYRSHFESFFRLGQHYIWRRIRRGPLQKRWILKLHCTLSIEKPSQSLTSVHCLVTLIYLTPEIKAKLERGALLLAGAKGLDPQSFLYLRSSDTLLQGEDLICSSHILQSLDSSSRRCKTIQFLPFNIFNQHPRFWQRLTYIPRSILLITVYPVISFKVGLWSSL